MDGPSLVINLRIARATLLKVSLNDVVDRLVVVVYPLRNLIDRHSVDCAHMYDVDALHVGQDPVLVGRSPWALDPLTWISYDPRALLFPHHLMIWVELLLIERVVYSRKCLPYQVRKRESVRALDFTLWACGVPIGFIPNLSIIWILSRLNHWPIVGKTRSVSFSCHLLREFLISFPGT